MLDDHRRLFPILGVVEASPPELSLLLGDGGCFTLLAALALFGHKVALHLKLRGGHRHVGAHRVPERRPVQDGTRELDAGFLEVGHQPVSFQRVRLFVPVEFDPRRGGVPVELDDAALAEHLLHLVHVDVVREARDVDGCVGLEVEPPGAVAVVRVRHPGLLPLGASLLLLLDGVDGHRAHLRRGWIFGRLLGIGPDVVVVVAAALQRRDRLLRVVEGRDRVVFVLEDHVGGAPSRRRGGRGRGHHVLPLRLVLSGGAIPDVHRPVVVLELELLGGAIAGIVILHGCRLHRRDLSLERGEFILGGHGDARASDNGRIGPLLAFVTSAKGARPSRAAGSTTETHGFVITRRRVYRASLSIPRGSPGGLEAQPPARPAMPRAPQQRGIPTEKLGAAGPQG